MKKILPFLFVIIFTLNNAFAQCTNPTGGSITGKSSGCTDRVEIYEITGVTGANDYEWTITGASGNTRLSATRYSIVFGSAAVSISVVPKNGTCLGTAVTKTISVSNTPNKPIISQVGSEIQSSTTATSYQWYLNSAPVGGATAKSFAPITNGVYIVEAVSAGGCSVFSDGFNYVRTAIKEDAVFGAFSFYPNPITTDVSVDFTERYDLDFFDFTGRKILSKQNLQGKQTIDLTTYNRGLYLMRITSGGKTAVRKLLLK
ncbi:T9SS type A sorting domain-containing protein [Pedobacter alpinus]|uniref:T9SS type A sorting domain-containing protein n=1 Tax=Pedobacter alpinus TaxID=1590643 RepID=A0ABW5TLD2_9SPHI